MRSPAVAYVKFDLALHGLDAGDALALYLDYRSALFDATTMRRFADHLGNLLAAALADPDRPLAALPLLAAAERHQLVVEWSGESPAPVAVCIHERVAAWARRAPDAVAVETAAERLTYGELARRAAIVARRLRTLGVGPEARVGVCLERSPGLAVALLAVLEAGGAYVPLDPEYPRERLQWMLVDCGAAVMVTSRTLTQPRSLSPLTPLSRLPDPLPGRGGDLALLYVDDLENAPDAAPPPAPATADGLAYVMYTSGSTGRPKGVAVTHRGVARLVSAPGFARLDGGQVFLQIAPLSFDASTLEIWGCLANGGRLVLPPPGQPSLEQLAALVERHGVTTLHLTSALFQQLAEGDLGRLHPVRQLLAGGDVLPPWTVRRYLAALPGVRLSNCYGPTENTTFTTTHAMTGPAAVPAAGVPVGRPIAGTGVHVLDRELRPVAIGSVGELFAGGAGLARGYHGRPELTAERFVPHPLAGRPGERLYRTGDRARFRADGVLEFLGRADGQLKVRGFRVEPAEVEAALGGHPGVREAAVVARRGAPGDERLVAYLVATPEEEAPAAELRQFLADRLPPHMVPSAFVALAALPLTPAGKVDRRVLAALDLAPAPEEEGRAFAAPRTPVEEILAAAWQEVLGVERVGVRDDFFALGGHSLLATRILSRLRGAFSASPIELSLRAFFAEPTVAGLARRVEAARQAAAGWRVPPIPRVPRDRPLRLSFGQERLWLAEQLQPGTGAYDSFLPVMLSGALEVPALARVLAEVVRRHEVLRTTFTPGAGGPVQAIAPPPARWPLPVVDLGALPEPLRDAELRRQNAAEARWPFDLERGPLLRATLLRLGAREHALFLNLHHAVCDGWSTAVLTREVGALYRACRAGRPSPLPALPIQYADFAAWQRRWLTGEVLERQLAYWRGRLGQDPPPLDLPTDRPRPPVPGARGGFAGRTLPPDLAAALRALGGRHGGTLFITLLAAFQLLLHRYSGQARVNVGTPVAGRTRVEVEDLIGFFVNTLVLSTDLAGDPDLAALLGRVRAGTLAAFDHQDLPFEKLVAALASGRDLGRQPLFQVMLVLQNNRREKLDLPDLEMTALPPAGRVTQFDLVLGAVELEAGVALNLAYAADLFEPATAERLLGHFEALLAAMAAAPRGPVAALPPLAAAERLQLVTATAALPAPSAVQNATPIAERRRQLSSRRRQLSPERHALLRKWVGGAAPAAPPAAPEEPAAAPFSPLVPLQPAGSRPPLFLVHPVGGGVQSYLELARRLGPDLPVYGLQSPGLAAGEPFASVHEMAAAYVAAILKVQPRGPYRLGGWSTGGTVAFEMAHRLRRRGEEIELLVLLDVHALAPDQRDAPVDEAEMLSSLAENFGGAGRGLRLPVAELRRIPPAERLDWILATARQRRLLPATVGREQLRRFWHVYERNTRAMERHALQPGPFPALLFRATEQPPAAQGLPRLGWERWIAASLEVVAVAGDHHALFAEPGLSLLVDRLRSRLAPVAAERASP
jgi:amino acid adenylation domain-containing protein